MGCQKGVLDGTVVNGGVVFNDVVAKNFRARAPIMKKITMSGPTSEPVEFLIH